MVDVLGVPHATAELCPTSLVFLLEGVVAPDVLDPLGDKPFVHAKSEASVICTLRNTPTVGLFAPDTLVGAECQVEVPRCTELELASLAVLVLEHVETANVGVGVVGDIFVDDVVRCCFNIQNVETAVGGDVALVAFLLNGVEEVLDILLLFLGGVFLFRGTHHDRGAVLALETFLV